MQNKILALVMDAARELGEDLDVETLQHPSEETALIGAKSGVDSIALVGLIADIEDRLSDELGLNLVLADERAMSQRTSPFRRISSLVKYIDVLQAENNKGA